MTENTKQNQQEENELQQEDDKARRKFLKHAGTAGTASAVAMLLAKSKPASAQSGGGCGGALRPWRRHCSHASHDRAWSGAGAGPTSFATSSALWTARWPAT